MKIDTEFAKKKQKKTTRFYKAVLAPHLYLFMTLNKLSNLINIFASSFTARWQESILRSTQ